MTRELKGIRLMQRPWRPQDLIDDLQILIDEEPDGYLNDRRTTLCMARDFLKEHFAEPRWISVEERLPKENGRYLIASKFSGHIFAEILSWTPQYDGPEEYLQGKAIWFDYDSEYGDYEYTGVTHWMPLPKLPEVEA